MTIDDCARVKKGSFRYYKLMTQRERDKLRIETDSKASTIYGFLLGSVFAHIVYIVFEIIKFMTVTPIIMYDTSKAFLIYFSLLAVAAVVFAVILWRTRKK